MQFARYRITTAMGEVFTGVTDKDGLSMSVHTSLPGALSIELPESDKWISFSAPQALNYCGLKCTATMEDGEALDGEFDQDNKATFYPLTGNVCVKFEVLSLARDADLPGSVETLLRELSE
jgi:type VI secretion system secreted protein VgrG